MVIHLKNQLRLNERDKISATSAVATVGHKLRSDCRLAVARGTLSYCQPFILFCMSCRYWLRYIERSSWLIWDNHSASVYSVCYLGNFNDEWWFQWFSWNWLYYLHTYHRCRPFQILHSNQCSVNFFGSLIISADSYFQFKRLHSIFVEQNVW